MNKIEISKLKIEIKTLNQQEKSILLEDTFKEAIFI